MGSRFKPASPNQPLERANCSNMPFLMRIVSVLVLAGLLMGGATEAASPPSGCAFTDERVASLFFLYNLAAEHFVAHRTWPTSSDELLKQYLRGGKKADAAILFGRFRSITLKTTGKELRLDVRTRGPELIKMHRVILHPGKSSEEILEAATYPNAA